MIPQHATVGDALNVLRKFQFDIIDQIYVVNEQYKLIGLIRLSRLLPLQEATSIDELIDKDPKYVGPETDQELAATIVVKNNLSSVPVVDDKEKFLGVVPARAIISVLRKEHINDMHRLVGISQAYSEAEKTINANPFTKLRNRLPWLFVGLFGSFGATYIMSRFESNIQHTVALAFFVPGIVYLADAIGTQSETIAVRNLSLTDYPLKRIMLTEMVTGFLIGLIFAAFYFIFCQIVYRDLTLALTVSITILVTGSLATTVGIALPTLLNYFKIDPAFGSGPLATIIQDMLSIITYFLISAWLMTAFI